MSASACRHGKEIKQVTHAKETQNEDGYGRTRKLVARDAAVLVLVKSLHPDISTRKERREKERWQR